VSLYSALLILINKDQGPDTPNSNAPPEPAPTPIIRYFNLFFIGINLYINTSHTIVHVMFKRLTCLTKGEIKRENHFFPLLSSFLSFSNLFIPFPYSFLESVVEEAGDKEMKDDNPFCFSDDLVPISRSVAVNDLIPKPDDEEVDNEIKEVIVFNSYVI
jgi:hypothetical protein